MYQWSERRSDSGDNKHYSYSAKWSDLPISSSSFHKPSYTNPPMPAIRGGTFYPREMRIGEYRLGSAVLASIDGLSLIHPEGFDSKQVNGLIFQAQGSFLQSGQRSVPKVGDVRVSWYSAPPGSYTALAGQSGNNLIVRHASNNGKIAALVPGKITRDQMFDRDFNENAILAWSLRLLFSGILIAGCVAIIDCLTRFIPFLGNLSDGY